MGAIKQKDINLLAALEKIEAKEAKAKRASPVPAAVLAAVVCGLGVFWFYQGAEVSGLKVEQARAEAFLAENEGQVQATNQALSDAENMRAQAEAMKTITSAVESYPDLSSDQLRRVFEVASGRATLENISYDRSTGELSFGARTSTASGVSLFVAQLRQTGMFAEVTYDGYSGGGDAGYSANVRCVLSAPGGDA
ncbi:MAG: hypothetical protein LBR44_06965 [Clostridiales Family XIII bacterium]|jgi:hypothetical protein|nr:hypothetical protein [Clostridiales Family XIII bacterium]